MTIPLVRLIIYARDIAKLKAFYVQQFDLPAIEEIEGEWVVLQAGQIELALHLAGNRYRSTSKNGDDPDQTSDVDSGRSAGPATKFVFAIDSGLKVHREKLLAAGARVGDIKHYEGFPYQMYDGRDPEGNVFQVMQFD